MKRLLAFLLSLLILLNLAACAKTGTTPPTVSDSAESALPAVGDKMEGFTVTAVEPFDMLSADLVYLEHDATGAQFLWIANDDTNRSFTINFKTKYDNDKGVPHVFEHAALSGSQKYPDPSLFFSFMSSTYHTYLNAGTYTDHTIYPCASMSEAQLLKFADYYLAGVFHPLVVSDPHAMMREAYRYELDDVDGQMSLTGVVYSEMLGSYYNSSAVYQLMKLLQPGSWQGTCTGGKPGVIETMTHQDLIDYHNTYYQPSNSVIILYGDVDPVPFLKLLNEEYFRGAGRTEADFSDPNYQPFTGFSEVYETVPAAADSTPERDIYYAIRLDGLTEEACVILEQLTGTVLSSPSSPLFKLCMERYPESSFGSEFWRSSNFTGILFHLNKAPTDLSGADFSAAIQEGVATILREGIDPELLRSTVKNSRISLAKARENSNCGVDTSESLLIEYAYSNDLSAYPRKMDMIQNQLEGWVDDGTVERLFTRFLENPENTRGIVLDSVPGALEEEMQRLNEATAQKQAAMTLEEKQALVEKTQEYNQWLSQEEENMLDQLQAVSVAQLPEEVTSPQVDETRIDGIRVITSPVEDSELVSVSLLFDTGMVPAEDVPKLPFLSGLLGAIRTDGHTSDEMNHLCSQYGMGMSANYLEKASDSQFYAPVFKVSFLCLKEDANAALELAQEILTTSRFDESDLILYYASYLLNDEKNNAIGYNAYATGLYYGLGAVSQKGLYNYHLNALPYLQYLDSVVNGDISIDAVAADMQRLAGMIFNQNGAAVIVSASDDVLETVAKRAAALCAALSDEKQEPVDYSGAFTPLNTREAIVVDGSSNHNIRMIRTSDLSVPYDSRMNALCELLIDRYLMPEMRFKNGVYGPTCNISENILYVMAYSDPSIANTYDVIIPTIGQQCRSLELSQKDLDNYILSTYSSLTTPQGPLSRAVAAAFDLLVGENSAAVKLEKMRVLKTFTPEDVKTLSVIFDELNEKGVTVTAGSSQCIAAEENRFEEVLTWYVE